MKICADCKAKSTLTPNSIYCEPCGSKPIDASKMRSLSFGRVFHGYFDKGEGRFFGSKKEMADHAKQTGQVFASNEELHTEATKNRVYNEKKKKEDFDSYMEPHAVRIANMSA